MDRKAGGTEKEWIMCVCVCVCGWWWWGGGVVGRDIECR